MRIIKIKKVEDCLESTNVRDVLLDESISKKFIDHMGKLGKLVYYESFAKPFFKVIVRGEYTIKGAQTNSEFRIMLPESATEEAIEPIVNHIGEYEE
jgi:hypothetical protein